MSTRKLPGVAKTEKSSIIFLIMSRSSSLSDCGRYPYAIEKTVYAIILPNFNTQWRRRRDHVHVRSHMV